MLIFTPLFFKFYYLLLGLVLLSRLVELQRAKNNTRDLIRRGGREYRPDTYPWVILLHGAWLLSCFFEPLLRPVPPAPLLSMGACALFLLGYTLRLLAMETLGTRWTTRILILPKEAPVKWGIYQYLKHPNYWGVILEVAAVPLIAGSWLTAILFSLLNLFFLKKRVRLEEKVWAQVPMVKNIETAGVGE